MQEVVQPAHEQYQQVAVPPATCFVCLGSLSNPTIPVCCWGGAACLSCIKAWAQVPARACPLCRAAGPVRVAGAWRNAVDYDVITLAPGTSMARQCTPHAHRTAVYVLQPSAHGPRRVLPAGVAQHAHARPLRAFIQREVAAMLGKLSDDVVASAVISSLHSTGTGDAAVAALCYWLPEQAASRLCVEIELYLAAGWPELSDWDACVQYTWGRASAGALPAPGAPAQPSAAVEASHTSHSSGAADSAARALPE